MKLVSYDTTVNHICGEIPKVVHVIALTVNGPLETENEYLGR